MIQAVFSGVNIYKYYCKPPNDDTLRGCVTDSNNLRKWAVNELGFKPGDIILLQDSRATAAAVMKAVWDMVTSQTGPGKQLFWSHSSHGTNNPDPSQRDGLQELLCCYDIQESNGLWVSGFIAAKEIGQLCTQVRPVDTLNIIIDACHAPQGDQLKEFGRRYDCARFLPRSVVGRKVKPKTVKRMQVAYQIPRNVALWSSCEPQQTSADAYIDKTWQGAFTAALLKGYARGRTRAEIMGLARDWLRENGYAQTPRLYCWNKMAQGVMG